MSQNILPKNMNKSFGDTYCITIFAGLGWRIETKPEVGYYCFFTNTIFWDIFWALSTKCKIRKCFVKMKMVFRLKCDLVRTSTPLCALFCVTERPTPHFFWTKFFGTNFFGTKYFWTNFFLDHFFWKLLATTVYKVVVAFFKYFKSRLFAFAGGSPPCTPRCSAGGRPIGQDIMQKL